MDRNSVDWEGPIPALVTPFDADGSLNEEKFRENIDLVLTSGANGVLVGGCSGEFWSQTDEERVNLMKIAVDAVRKRGTVLAGTSAIEVDRAADLTRAAKEAGCDGALLLPPYFVRLNDNDLVAHFEKVSAKVEFPIIVYNIPANATNSVGPDLAARLAKVKNVVAIKESSGDWENYYKTFVTVAEDIKVFCGPSHMFGAQATLAGADGTIDILPNIWRSHCNNLYHFVKAGRVQEAMKLQVQGVRLAELFTSNNMSLYTATKHAMNHLGLPGGHMRPPYYPLSPEQAAPFEAALDGGALNS